MGLKDRLRRIEDALQKRAAPGAGPDRRLDVIEARVAAAVVSNALPPADGDPIVEAFRRDLEAFGMAESPEAMRRAAALAEQYRPWIEACAGAPVEVVAT